MESILIADAGSSKTDWSLIMNNEKSVIRVNSEGINPAHIASNELLGVIKSVKKQLPEVNVSKIFYFGAGCATSELITKVSDALQIVWKRAIINVQSDLAGAAIALFAEGNGIACILGTGSATGYFSQGHLINRIPSLGYILGDEGSAFSLGKRLINAVFKKQLPELLIDDFQNIYNITLDSLIHNVYDAPRPAAYIASFAPFLKNNIDNKIIQKLVEEEFDSFFIKNILPYGNIHGQTIGFVGSIAYNFSDILKKVVNRYHLNLAGIIKNPIIYLENYYRKNEKAF